MMKYLVAALAVVVIFEAVVIFRLRAKNKRLVVNNAVHLFKEHLTIDGQSNPGCEDEEIPELSEEEDQQQAEQVQKVQILCRLAETHLDDLSDEYESNQLMNRINKATEMASEITDPFYFGAALSPVIKLAYQAGWDDKKDELIGMVSDPLIKEKIVKGLGAENT